VLIQLSPKPSPKSSLLLGLGTFKDFLDDAIRPKMTRVAEFIEKAQSCPFLPPWKPDNSDPLVKAHFEVLAIPMNDGVPSLLLHDLDKQLSDKQQKHIENVFGMTMKCLQLVFLLMVSECLSYDMA
jgi:hypothetical protein